MKQRCVDPVHAFQQLLQRDSATLMNCSLNSIARSHNERVLHSAPHNAAAYALSDKVGEAFSFIKHGERITTDGGLDPH